MVLEALRAMTPGERLRLASRLSVEADELRMAGLRVRHPEADQSELFMRLLALKHGAPFVESTFGWTAA
jgi:hypothetical protein